MARNVRFRAWLALVLGVAYTAYAVHATHAGPLASLDFQWTALTPLTVDDRATLQSEPAVAADGNAALVVWTDSRNALPDIYAAYLIGSQVIHEQRITNLTPHFASSRVPAAAKQPAVLLKGDRAVVAWSAAQQLYISQILISNTFQITTSEVVTASAWDEVAQRPRLAGDADGEFNLVWTDFRERSANGLRPGDIYAARCDGSVTPVHCSTPVRVNDDAVPTNTQRHPVISRYKDQVVIVWEDTREAGLNYPRIYASISNDGGQTWGANMRVNHRLDGNAPGPRDAATKPAVAHAPDGSIYVVWEHRAGSPTAPPDIYAARWNGTKWETPERVDSAPRNVRSVNPTIVVGGGTVGVGVAWQDYRNGSANADIYAARRLWWEASAWTEIPTPITQPGAQTSPALYATFSGARLVWQDARNGQADVYIATWKNDGITNAVQLNTQPARLPYQMYPVLASHGGQTWALFTDQGKGAPNLYLSQMISPTKWSLPMALPTAVRVGGSLSVGSGGIAFTQDGRLHAVWSDSLWPRGTRVFYSVLSDTTWLPPIALSRVITGDEMLATIATFGQTLAVGWTRYNRTDRSAQLYATWNTGSGWVTETAVLTTPMANRWQIPFALAVDASHVYVAWEQPQPSSSETLLMLARHRLEATDGWSYHRIDQPQNVTWCPNYAPALKVDQSGVLHVTWAGCQRRVPNRTWPLDGYALYAHSTDQGATWSAPLRVGQTTTNTASARTRPTLALGAQGQVMVVFPSLLSGNGSNEGAFVAAMVQDGAIAFTHTLKSDSKWTPSDHYRNIWYEGDSAGSAVFDPVARRFIVALIDRSNGRAPRIWTTTYADNAFGPRAFLPLVLLDSE